MNRWLLLAGLLLGATLRFASLSTRPMHADEAMLADKTGTLVETGRWRYDPGVHHGPLLPYLTAAVARAAGRSNYISLDETILRAVPAACGLLLVLAPLLIAGSLGTAATAWAVLVAACSPALVYYSRYYIPETLLALASFLTLVSVWNAIQTRKAAWAAAAAVSAGLALASKETALLHFAAMTLAFLAARKPGHQALLVAVASAAGIAILFVVFRDAFLPRAFADGPHIHPWHFYLRALLFSRFTEAAVLLLALCVTGGGLPRLLALYSLLLLIAYSLIPYKTPWSLISFWQPVTVLAGAGAARIIQAWPGRSLAPAVCGLACALLAWQAFLASFRYSSDPRNPYVYAHTGTDVFLIRDRVQSLLEADSRGRALPVQVFSRTNLWPLPWYFRSLQGVQWWRGVPDTAPAAPLILATPDAEDAVATLLYERRPPGERELYMRMFDRPVELRPGVEVRGYVAKSLWDKAATR